jgi:amino acid permease
MARVILAVLVGTFSLGEAAWLWPRAQPGVGPPRIAVSRGRLMMTDRCDGEKEGAAAAGAPPVGNPRSGSVPAVTLACAIFNMLIGTGAYCVPAAARGVPLATTLGCFAVLGLASACTFGLIGLFCERTGADSLDELWLEAGPPLGLPARLPSFAIVLYTIGVLVQIQIALAGLVAPFVRAGMETGGDWGSLPGLAWIAADPNRGAILATAPLLLGALLTWRDLASLAPSSAAGVAAKTLAACLVMLRAADGSYSAGSQFFDSSSAALAAAAPATTPVASVVPLVSALCTVYMGHVNVPRFYRELEASSPRRFAAVSGAAFLAATTVYAVIAVAFRALFGDAVADFALNSFSAADPLARVAQIATAFGVVSSFCLIQVASRSVIAQAGGDGLRQLLGVRASRSDASDATRAAELRAVDTQLTICLFALTTFGALAGASKLLFVVALRGALLGTLIVYVLPAAIGLQLTASRVDASRSRARRAESAAYALLLLAGGSVMVVATANVIQRFLL